MRCLVAHDKSKNVNARLIGNKVSINNKIYGHKDLDKLPDGLKLCDAKLVETPKGLAFQSHHTFLSNFYPSKVNFNGKHFKSAEHPYQFSRATFLGDTVSADKVLEAGKAEEAKRAVSNLPNSKEWDACKQKVMKDIVSAKFAKIVICRLSYFLREKLLSLKLRTIRIGDVACHYRLENS